MKVEGSPACTDQQMLGFRSLRGGVKTESRSITQALRIPDFGFFSDVLGRVPWVRHWRGERPRKAGWYLPPLSSRVVHPNEQEVKQKCQGPVWMSKGLLTKLKHKQEMHRRQKRCVTWEEYRDTVQLCRNAVGNIKAYLELNLRIVTGNKKDICKRTAGVSTGCILL